MNLSDFDYTYPPELVATHPLAERDASRMLVLNRNTGTIEHQTFKNFPDYFSAGDILVLNNTKVFPCRLIGRKKTGGKVELLLTKKIEPTAWQTMPLNKVKEGDVLFFDEELEGTVVKKTDDDLVIRFSDSLDEKLDRIGHIPLPPYLHRDDVTEDKQRYQTIYAEKTGSIAAPTAGFHFTQPLLDTLTQKGVRIVYVTLHVGAGTFIPIRTEKIEDHHMHGESYDISPDTAATINQAKKEGIKITVVGTTATRAVESAWDAQQGLKSGNGYTEKFIYQSNSFHIVDRLFTNFHQPRSTLLVLVSALAGRENILTAYRQAIDHRYRLFSYGDCMLIL